MPRGKPQPIFYIENEDWLEFAACKEYSGPIYEEFWFPANSTRKMHPTAKQICNGCPVKQQCKDYVMKREGTMGLYLRNGNFAGLTPYERWKLSKES